MFKQSPLFQVALVHDKEKRKAFFKEKEWEICVHSFDHRLDLSRSFEALALPMRIPHRRRTYPAERTA